MAVAPLQIPSYYAPQAVDFSPLERLGQNLRRSREDDLRRQAIQQYGATGNVRDLYSTGDLSLAQLAAKLDEARRGATGVYGTPIYGTDAQGNMVLGAIGKNGEFKRIDTGGVTPTPGGIKPVDVGGYYVPFDPRRGGVSGSPIPKTGNVSTDYQPVPGPGGTISAVPIPGTPAAQKIEDESRKAEQRAQQTIETGELVKTNIEDARELAKSAPFYNPAVGFGAERLSNVGGTNAANLKQITNTIRGNIGFDRLQRMREESPTGGALGQVAVQELQALQATLGSLEQSQSREQFLRNLNRVEQIYNRIIKKAAAYPNAARYGFAPQGQPTQIQPVQPQQAPSQFQRGQTATNPQTGERVMFDGQRWVPAP